MTSLATHAHRAVHDATSTYQSNHHPHQRQCHVTETRVVGVSRRRRSVPQRPDITSVPCLMARERKLHSRYVSIRSRTDPAICSSLSLVFDTRLV